MNYGVRQRLKNWRFWLTAPYVLAVSAPVFIFYWIGLAVKPLSIKAYNVFSYPANVQCDYLLIGKITEWVEKNETHRI